MEVDWATLRTHLDVVLQEDLDGDAFTISVGAIERLSPDLLGQADAVVRMYEGLSEHKVARVRMIQVGFFASALALLSAGLIMIRKSVLRPLQSLSNTAHRIGQGDLTTRVVLPGPKEIENLAGSLEGMRSQLQQATEGLERQVEKRTRELAALYEVSRDITSHLEINDVLASVTEKSKELLASEIAFLCMLEPSGQVLTLRAMHGAEAALFRASISAQTPLAREVLSRSDAISCGVGDCSGACGVIAEGYRVSHLAAPLRVGERVIGALCVGSTRAQAFSSEDFGLLTKLANSAAIALENAMLFDRAERVAMLEERQRIAAEMHDGLAQVLDYLKLKTEHLAAQVDEGRRNEALAELDLIRQAIVQAGHEVRRAITRLHERAPTNRSLQDRLREAVDSMIGNGGPSIELIMGNAPPLYPVESEVEQVLRVVQEALQNAHRHAGARQLVVRLAPSDSELHVTVEDDGRGFDPDARPSDNLGHFGLSIMRARANRLGGQLAVQTALGKGTRVSLTWPTVDSSPVEHNRTDG
jgi:two-component system nitrate/nitrite sensor histidine kinase NarX